MTVDGLLETTDSSFELKNCRGGLNCLQKDCFKKLLKDLDELCKLNTNKVEDEHLRKVLSMIFMTRLPPDSRFLWKPCKECTSLPYSHEKFPE